MNTYLIGFGSVALIITWMIAGIVEVTKKSKKF